MKRVAYGVLILLAGLLVAGSARAKTEVDLILALAVDVSRSIDAAEARLQREGYIAAFRDPEVIRAIRSGPHGRIAVSYFEWAGFGYAKVIAAWTLIDGAASAHAFADTLERNPPIPERRTSISDAIDFALPWLSKHDFVAHRRVVDISGDGPNNWGELVTVARDRAIRAGITINGLPILDEGGGPYSRFNIPNLDLYYRDCVIGGPGAFVVVAADFKDFARAIRRKLILEVAGQIPDAGPELLRAQAVTEPRVSPPCDIGEKIMQRSEDF